MSKLIAITGGTGAQGGGVANILLETPGWKVRIITRNSDSDKARALAARGAEVRQASFDDEQSLITAFEGANAVFAVTNFWEHLFTGKSPEEAGKAEAVQAWNIAQAAAKTSSLEHYIWSTLPSADKLSNGEHKCAHLDYKANVDERIRAELPSLAEKTTYLFFGYYPSNMAFLPPFKPFEMPGSYGKYVQILPAHGNVKTPVSGDMNINPGVWVRQTLAHPEKSKGKYADVAPEVLTFGEILKIWSKVTGRQTVQVETTKDDYISLWGHAGAELFDQLSFQNTIEDWHAGVDFVGMEELGIKNEDVGGCKAALEALKEFL